MQDYNYPNYNPAKVKNTAILKIVMIAEGDLKNLLVLTACLLPIFARNNSCIEFQLKRKPPAISPCCRPCTG